jgi:hypothetical protein
LFNKLRLKTGLTLAILASVVMGPAAFAVGPDYSAITTAADWTAATVALGVIAGALALFLVYKKGARGVLSMIGR